MREAEQIFGSLLAWYDAHARTLPWRVGPADRAAGIRPEPYAVWLSEVMLQQTTVAVVIPYFNAFRHAWPDVGALAGAADADVMAAWAGLGYYARARNLLKCARIVAGDLGGIFPETRIELIALPGIGPYTAAAIAAIAFDQPETVVDGNVERVMARLFAVETPLPAAKPDLVRLAAGLTTDHRPGDYAQALMDLGASVCRPRAPACGICPLAQNCLARNRGMATELPHRVRKAAKPVRRGVAYLARRSDGAWLVERRPDAGLLGGMLGWPGSAWAEGPVCPVAEPPVPGAWTEVPGEVRHTFTHFHLRLRLMSASVGTDARPRRGYFAPADRFSPGDLPTVMRKAFELTQAHLPAD